MSDHRGSSSGASSTGPKKRVRYDRRARVQVAHERDLRTRFAANLSSGGMFIQDPNPASIGAKILVEFVLPEGEVLCRAAGEVLHSRPSLTRGDTHSGMGIRFTGFDPVAKRLASEARSQSQPSAQTKPPPRPLRVPDSGPVVGIDLGTVNSCVAFVGAEGPEIIATDKGHETLPSIVYFDESATPTVVGHAARERMVLEPGRVVYGSKRFLGRSFRSAEVQALGHFFNYQLAEGPNGHAVAVVGDKQVPLEHVAAQMLSSLVELASVRLGTPVHRAVVTVPAYFGESQRAATIAAGRHANLKIERLINEPTAAALAFGLSHQSDAEFVLAYDLGGGTFDASLLKIDGPTMSVLASEGDPFLGGTDFDDRLVQYVLFSAEREHKVDLRGDPVAVQRIRFACESAKRQLSDANVAFIDIPYLANGALDLRVPLSRDLFFSLTQDLVDRTIQIVQRVLDRAKVKGEEIDELLLIGGQSRSPHVADALKARFGKQPSKRVHADHAVALGAAALAGQLFGSSVTRESASASAPAPPPRPPLELREIVTASLHLVGADGALVTLFERGAKLPVEVEVGLAPSSKSASEYHVTLVRGEHDTEQANERVCSIQVPSTLSASLAGTKLKVRVALSSDGQLTLHAEHPITRAKEELTMSFQ